MGRAGVTAFTPVNASARGRNGRQSLGMTRARLLLPVAALGLALAVPATTGAQDAFRDPLQPEGGKYLTLSNEKTLTRWAYTNLVRKVRRSPSTRSRSISRLRFQTEDRLPELYIALRAHTDSSGRHWVQIRVLGRPNGRKGWVPREALGEFHVVRKQLVINRRTLKATLFNRGRRVFTTRVGVGKSGTPTPGGHFYVRERLRGFGNPVYGPFAFGTSAYSRLSDWPGGGVVGIHGTNQPHLIPGRPSHGCIRMKNSAILRLSRLMPVGTPIRIL